MKILFAILMLNLTLFGFNLNETKQILDKNDTKEILQKLKSKDSFYFLGYAIKENRLDILKLAIKNDFDFNKTDENGGTLLDFSAFFINKEAVKLLIHIINPNHISKRGLNSLRFVLRGLSQEYRWVYSSKEKLIKMFKDENNSNEIIKNNLKYYDYLRKSALEIIDILKENGAKFELKGAYPNEISFFISAREGRVDSNFKYKLIEKILDDKGKLFFYIGNNEFDKAKKLIKANPNILKEPYFLDYNRHFFYVLQKDKKYCEIVEYLIKEALKENFHILEYYVTNDKTTTFYDKYKANCFKKLYKKYEYKYKYDFESYDVYKFMKEKDYTNLEKYVSEPGWNFTVFKDDKFLDYTISNPFIGADTNPFLEALLNYYDDKKILNILLKHGGYLSGWNEIHYKILKHQKLNLEKYSKWERVLKLNQGDLAKNITPIFLAILENDFNLVKKLVKNGANLDVKIGNGYNIIEFAIYYNVNNEIIKYLIDQKKYIDKSILKRLATHRNFEILKYIKDNNISSKYQNLKKLSKQTLKELQDTLNHLPPYQREQFKKEVIDRFKKFFLTFTLSQKHKIPDWQNP